MSDRYTREKRAEYNRAYREQNGEVLRERERAYNKTRDTAQYTATRKAGRKAWVAGIKLERGCVNCGYNKSARALSFHHRDPKEKSFSISQRLLYAEGDLIAEMDKCDILCANCHLELHEQAAS